MPRQTRSKTKIRKYPWPPTGEEPDDLTNEEILKEQKRLEALEKNAVGALMQERPRNAEPLPASAADTDADMASIDLAMPPSVFKDDRPTKKQSKLYGWFPDKVESPMWNQGARDPGYKKDISKPVSTAGKLTGDALKWAGLNPLEQDAVLGLLKLQNDGVPVSIAAALSSFAGVASPATQSAGRRATPQDDPKVRKAAVSIPGRQLRHNRILTQRAEQNQGSGSPAQSFAQEEIDWLVQYFGRADNRRLVQSGNYSILVRDLNNNFEGRRFPFGKAHPTRWIIRKKRVEEHIESYCNRNKQVRDAMHRPVDEPSSKGLLVERSTEEQTKKRKTEDALDMEENTDASIHRGKRSREDALPTIDEATLKGTDHPNYFLVNVRGVPAARPADETDLQHPHIKRITAIQAQIAALTAEADRILRDSKSVKKASNSTADSNKRTDRAF